MAAEPATLVRRVRQTKFQHVISMRKLFVLNPNTSNGPPQTAVSIVSTNKINFETFLSVLNYVITIIIYQEWDYCGIYNLN